MARPRKNNLSLQEQIEQVSAQIEELEVQIKEAKKAKKELEARVDSEKLSNLDALISEKGLSYEDVIAMLESK